MKRLTIGHRLTNRDNNSFNLYLKDIYSIAVLTPEEERIISDKASLGDKKAKDELVRRNLKFVISVAKQYASDLNPVEDLVNEGNIGLIIAADKFKPNMGFRFISYAVWWIRKTICEHLTKNGRMVRLPANKVNSLSMLDKKTNELEQKLGRSVDIHDILSEYGEVFINQDLELLEVLGTYNMDSLDRQIGSDDGNQTTLIDLICDESSYTSSDQLVMDGDTKSEITQALDTLKPREKRIMIALYGLDGSSPMTLKDIGDELGVTRETIRQIKDKTINKLYGKLKKYSYN